MITNNKEIIIAKILKKKNLMLKKSYNNLQIIIF